ncbi:MAG: GNAT family N-acetyltransferase [Candidatus Hermodarchaeota archaeon]
MKFTKPLETKRLFIRQLTQEDYELLINKVNDTFPEEEYPIFNYYKERDVYCFLIQLRESPQIIGYIFLRVYEMDKTIECYYALFPRYTGNGYAIEALRKVFDHIFQNDDFLQIVAYVEQGNARGWKVAERSGMKYMGDIFHEGKNSKVMSFLITKIDYLKQFQ